LGGAFSERYRIEQEIGHGGMAVVYLAQDTVRGRQVALKVLRPEIAAALGPERFLREIEIVGQLSHPRIVSLYESGCARQTLFYTMPYLGQSLLHRLAGGQQLPVNEAVTIALDVASALTYAHAHGIVHRDIKPGNILLSDHAMVADFGIARAITAAVLDPITSANLVVGTPEYMSPEQAVPGSVLDGRSDIYALGCVVYEMLAGRPAFSGATARTVLARQINESAPPLKVVRPDVPPRIEEAILACLAKRPADRPSTALELVEQLSTWRH
jgi:eukaryotic-like serine/threonine-protein kinase